METKREIHDAQILSKDLLIRLFLLDSFPLGELSLSYCWCNLLAGFHIAVVVFVLHELIY